MLPPLPADDEVDALVLPVWRMLAVDPAQLAEAAAALRLAASAARQSVRLQAFAEMFCARWHLACGESVQAQRLGEEALARARACGAEDAEAASVDVLAFVALQAGHLEEASRAVQPWLDRMQRMAEPLPGSWPILRYLMTNRVSIALERSGRAHEALGPGYAYIAAARATGLAPFVARALATVGGLQSSLFNLEDALTLCSEAWQLCEGEEWAGCMGVAGPNLMLALRGVGRLEDARTLAHRLLVLEPRLPPTQRPQRLFLYAVALAEAGERELAQACLDQGQSAQPPGTPPRCEWVWTQANLWLHAGRAREALELVGQQWARGPQIQSSHFPVDEFELQRAAARACEALGEYRQALLHEREAAAARERATRVAAQARQRTLQIQHELEGARQQRDQAQREQQRLAALNAQLQEASAAKTRFLAAASHDLRQPLHALTLQAAALRMHVQGAEPVHLLAAVQRCAASLTAMFDALLDLSRADMGAHKPQPEPFDLAHLLADLVEEHCAHAQAKGLRLALRVVPNVKLGHGAMSDPQLLAALLRNLLVNALRYTEVGTVLVCLRRESGGGVTHGDGLADQGADEGAGAEKGAEKGADGGPQRSAEGAGRGGGWRVQVRDSGIGIAPEHHARIFEEFYQVGNAERRREQGLGLGLAIAQRLARLLGHPLTLRSAPGRGTCFELRVPAAAGLLPRTAEEVPAVRLTGLRLAVLEDEPEVAGALVLLLRQWGAQVQAFESAQALMQQVAHSGPPQALLADHRLPGGTSGAEAAARLRASCGFALPALILSGDMSPSLAQHLRDTGLAHLPKPVPVEKLLQWLCGVAQEARPTGPPAA